MRAIKKLAAGLLVGLLALTPAGPAGADPAQPTTFPGSQPDAPVAVTLITGDRVTVAGDRVAVRPGTGREQVGFAISRAGAHRYVIPGDAVPLLAAGRLDRRLFDVALLAGDGYRQRPELPLILTSGDREATSAGSVATAAGAPVVRELPAVDGVAVRLPHADATGFWQHLTGPGAGPRSLAADVSTVWLDGLRQPSLDRSVPQVGAPAAWEAGLDGTGVTVAVLDTGIDATHPDLADRVVGQENFADEFEDDRDLVGHGTHVASTVAGTGAASGGQFRGVAPGAGLLDGKVCDQFGCLESWIIAGMQWAAEQGASVVNLSLGGPDTPGLDPVEQALEDLTASHGLLFVVAAGNSGPGGATIGSPASAGSALAVGAVDRQDQVASFSSRGPRIDGGLKPDLTAPGVSIVAANSKDGSLGVPGQPYTTLSGTSMATPHAAGAAAILAQQHPEWSPQQLKAGLMGAAAPRPDLPVTAQGAGRLDVARAITQPVTADPASLSFDRQPWPHQDDQPQTTTVTYRNHGDSEVTLDLAVTATGPGGAPAPAGMFVPDTTTLTIPAGGTAQVSLTADTATGEVDGYYGGQLTATAGDLRVQTPFGIDREVESYDLTLSHLDRDGHPTELYSDLLVAPDGSRFVDVFGGPEVTVRVPAGEYLLTSFLFPPTAESEDITVLAQPRLAVTDDATVTLDARTGQPISIRPPDRAAELVHTLVDIALADGPAFVFATGIAVPPAIHLLSARVGPAGPVPGLVTTVVAEHVVPAADGSRPAGRTAYHLGYAIEGDYVTGFDRTVPRHALARVRRDYAVQVAGAQLFTYAAPSHPVTFGRTVPVLVDGPLVRTELFNADAGVPWASLLEEVLPTGELVAFLDGEPTSYRPGRLHRERWNYAVFGPSVRSNPVTRAGDELIITPSLYADADDHAGFTPAAGTIRLFRDGELIAEQPSLGSAVVPVPPEPADYRVEVAATRAGSAPLSARTSLAWQFRSSHVDGDAPVPLPVWSVRFRPDLAPDNTARAGRPALVPVTVEPAPGAEPGGLAGLSVAVSFDDGATWRPAPVLADRFVLVFHPRSDGFVSLRATATDSAGNRVEQTVIRAYQIR